MITFERSEDLAMIRKTAEDFGRDKIRPQNRAAESQASVSQALRDEYATLGFDLIDVPEEWDGLAMGLLGRTDIEEALAYADAGIGLALGSFGVAHQMLLELASQSQREEWVKRFLQERAVISVAWSDLKPQLGQFATTAQEAEDGSWHLTGRKAHVLNGVLADYFIVFAHATSKSGEETPSAFLVAAESTGLRKSEALPSLGLEAAPFIELTLEHVNVPAAQLLSQAANDEAVIRALCRVSLLGAARQSGIAAAAFDLAHEHAENRHAFGKPIAHFQGLAFLIGSQPFLPTGCCQ